MTHLSFDFKLSVQTNMKNNLMVMQRDLRFCALRLYDDEVANRFIQLKFNCLYLRNQLLREDLISIFEWAALQEHYTFCCDLYQDHLLHSRKFFL